MKTFLLGATLLCGVTILAPLAPVQAQNINQTPNSELADVLLPSNTLRFERDEIPTEVSDALKSVMESAGDKIKRGRTEVLGWTGGGYKKSKAAEYKARVATALKKAGWEYEEGEKLEGTQGATMVSAIRTTPSRKALIGFWAPSDEALVLAWTEMLPIALERKEVFPPSDEPKADIKKSETKEESAPRVTPVGAPTIPTTPVGTVFNITDEQFVVNVAKGLPEPKVAFNKIAPKPGFVRGYVKGADGKPLSGAFIGVASTAVGGAETSASTKTNALGYYELKVPFGVARFYSAGYTKEYGDGLLVLGLTPADGDKDEFFSKQGHVENWILRPYGIADRAGVQDNPKYLNNYFGGSVTLEFLDEYSGIAGPKGIPFGSTVEVTLAPKGLLMDGSKGRTLTIRKAIKDGAENRLYVNNIPIGNYRMSARMINNGQTKGLKLEETGPDRGSSFGLSPKSTQGGTVELTFRPYSARASSATAGHGNWKEVDVNIMQ